MEFIKKIFLIIILVLTTFSFSIGNCTESNSIKRISVISAAKTFEKDFINIKDNEFSLSAVQNTNNTISARRNNKNNVPSNSGENIIIPIFKQFDKTIEYIHNQTDLDQNAELALLFLIHQIQPNAP